MAPQQGAQASWMPAEGQLKMPAGPTVNLLATAGSGAPAGAYSPASSPYARGSSASSRSSPAFISRTGSGASEDPPAGPELAAAAAAGSPTSGASASPHGASTPHPAPGRSNLGPGAGVLPGQHQVAEVEAAMHGGCRWAAGGCGSLPGAVLLAALGAAVLGAGWYRRAGW